MRKYFSSLIIMLAVYLGTLVIPAYAAETATVIPSGRTVIFSGTAENPKSFNNHHKEAQIENSGNISIRYAEFINNYLDEPNSKKKNYSAIYNITGTIEYIRGTNFSRNYTYTNGGAISNVTGVINEISGALTQNDIRNYQSTTMFKENQSSIGGAIYNNKTSRIELITGVLFHKNTATSNGGAIYSVGTMKDIKNSAFINNAAGGDGSKAAGFGGAIYAGKDLSVTNTNFINNSANRDGGAIAMVGGNLTLTASGENAYGVAKSMVFMDNLAGKNKNDLYFGGRNQTLNLFAETEGNRIVLDGGISIANSLNININKPVKTGMANGLGSVYINGDVGSDTARANLFIYGGTLSLSNFGTEAYQDTEDLSINTIWANKVSLYYDTKLGFDIYLSNDGVVDESAADQLKLNSVSGSGHFILTEDSFNVVEGILSDDFTSNFKLIDTKANISSRILMKDSNDNLTKILYLYMGTDNPVYKVRLATDGSIIFSNPYYIDEATNQLGYAINYPAVNGPETPCIGLGMSYSLTLKKNITINSWEDYPDENKNLQPRNKVLVDALFIYGKNKTITAEDNLVGFVVNKNCKDEAKYLYAENTTFLNFENAITNEGGKIDLSNVSFNGNGLADINGTITTLRGGALTNTSGEMNIAGTKRSPKSNFYNNKAKEGGAVYNSGVMTIDYSTFGGLTKNAGKKNEKVFLNAATYGGAIYNYQNADSKLTVNNTKFIANTAKDGGAVYNSYDKGTTLLENYVVYDGMVYDISSKDLEIVDRYFEGAVLEEGQIVYNGYVYNGATEVEKYISPTTLADAAEINKATFTYNKAERFGGAIYNEGNLKVIGSTFGSNKKTANVAGEAGAAVANFGDGIYTSRLSNYYSSSGNNGGAIYNTDNGTVNLEGGTFSSNVAKYCGGVIFNDKDATLTLNGYTNPVNNRLVYLTMSKNSAIYGGAIYNKGSINLVNGLKNLSGTYTSNKATYATQNIVYAENGRSDAYNLAEVAKLVSGDYDFIAKGVLPPAYLNNGKYIYYDYVTPKGGAIYNDGTILKENEVAFGDKIYNLNEITRLDEYTPEGALGVDNVIHPLVSTDLIRDNLVYDMSNAVMGEKYIEQTKLLDGQITQYITNDPTQTKGWHSTEDSGAQYNDPQSAIKGWFVFDGAEYVKDYVVGTPLLPGMVVYEDLIYTGAKYVADYVKGTPLGDNQIAYNDYIYNYEIIGDFVERTKLDNGEFRWINSPKGDAVYRGDLVEVGEYVDNLKENQIVYDGYIYNDPIEIGEYKPQTILKPGEFVHNGVVYSGQAVDMGAYTIGTQLKDNQMHIGNDVYEGITYIGTYRPATTLAPDQKVIDGNVYSGITYVSPYVEGTPLKNGQVVYNGEIYNNAKFVARYREGTPLGEDQIVVGDRGNGIIYDVEPGAKIRDNVDPSTVNQEELAANNQYLYGRTIYDLSKTKSTGISYIAPIKPVPNTQQIVYNGIIYDLNGAFNTGIEYVKPSDYDSSKHILINGNIYNKENAKFVGEYDPGTKLGPQQHVIDGKVYDFTNAKYIGQYVEPNLGNNPDEVVYNGRVYNIKDLVTVGPYDSGTRLGPNQHVIDGIIYEFTDENKGDKYETPTELGENQVVIEGIIYDTTNAEYVKPFEEGTVLGENEYRIGDQVYKLENTNIFYTEPVLPDPEKQEVVIDGKIYSLAEATERGEYIEGTVLGENEVLYDGKVYNIANAEKRQKYEFGTDLAEDEIVYNGYVYSKVECRGTYVPGTELAEDEIVYNGYIYSNAKPVGDYINGKLHINQASFKSNTANVKVVLKDNNSYMDETQMGLRYTQQITYYVGKGGAIYNASKLPVDIWSSKFTSNKVARYGGAICNENAESDLNIENTEFKSNSAKSIVTTVKTYIVIQGAKMTKRKQTIKENVGYGGAIYTLGSVFINTNELFKDKIRTTAFTSNSAAYGGGIYAFGEITIGGDTTFTSNSAVYDGGAIYCTNNNAIDKDLVRITDFDFNNLLGDNYIYEHSAYIDYDVDILATTTMPVTFSKNSAKVDGGAIYANKVLVQGATFKSNKASQNGGAIYANGDIAVNPYAFTKDDDGSIPKAIFTSNSAKNGGAIFANGTSLIKNAIFTSNKASGGYGGAVYAGDDSIIVGSDFNKNSAAYGGALYVGQYSTAYIINSNFTGNSASKQGGAIYADSYSKLYIMAYAGVNQTVDIMITGNKAAGKNNSIYMAEGSTIYVCAINYASSSRASITIDGVDGGNNKDTNVYLRGNGLVTVKNVKNVTFSDKETKEADGTNMGGIGVSIALVAENLVKGCSFYLSGSTVRIDNGRIGTLQADTLTLEKDSNIALDFDAKRAISDKVQANNIVGDGNLNVSSVNMISNSKTPVTINVGENSVVSSISAKTAESAEATYKLKSYYDENGLLRVVAYGQKAKPSAVAAPVAAQIGGYLTQINSYDQAFMNMDMNMLVPRSEREAMQQTYSCENKDGIEYNGKGLWNRPYATFERVNLNNGPKVNNIGYGNYFGGDADMKQLNNGWRRQFSAYVGYNGSVQDYDRQSIDQNGGTVGVTEVWYKNNFFTGLTLNAGANVAQASTDLGRENMPMFMTGIASKTGYNFEFKECKFIVQPSLLLSYSFIHTFAHDNGLGHRVSSSPLNAIQVAPGIKFIANLKNGWQPYFNVNMRWNIIDKTHFSLADVTIPDMSIDPYVEYGLGLQRRWGERFTGFGQAMIRNGGRNGVMLSFGFKWLLGK